MRWLINVPVWGDRYRKNFLENGLPAIKRALEYAGNPPHRFLIHTDTIGNPAAFSGMGLEGRYELPVPPGIDTTHQLGNADRIAIDLAEPGEAILFHNSDMVISRETFASCEERFGQGKQFIACASIRTLDRAPPQGLRARDLLDWGWHHRHRWVSDCIYGEGKCKEPCLIFYEEGGRLNHDADNVVLHSFDLHPLALRKSTHMAFTGVTACEVIGLFAWPEIHIVQSPDELAVVEPCVWSLPYRKFKRRKYNDGTVINWARRYVQWGHRSCWPQLKEQFRHQIVIRGEYSAKAQQHADKLMRRLEHGFVFPDLITIGLAIPTPLRRAIPKVIRQHVLRLA